MTEDDFLSLMAVDKKVLDGQLRLILLETVGKGIVTSEFAPELLVETLTSQLALARQ
jgi:3-dehydroquinate synthase